MQKSVKIFSMIALGLIAAIGTSGCVTQNYAEEKPVVDRAVNDKQKAKTRISLALSYLNMGNMAQAKFNLERAKDYAPKSVEVYSAFAHYFEVVGENEQAEEAYRKALDIDDNDADTLNNFGVFLCRQERVNEAENYFKAAIRVPSYLRVAQTYENIALCHLKIDNFTKAEHALERSLAHNPNRASGLQQLAQFNYAKGDYDQAAMYLSRFELATRRFTPQAMALAFKIQNNMGNADIAENYAKMLINMFPESDEALQYLDNGLVRIDEDKLADRYHQFILAKSKPISSPTLTAKSSSTRKAADKPKNTPTLKSQPTAKSGSDVDRQSVKNAPTVVAAVITPATKPTRLPKPEPVAKADKQTTAKDPATKAQPMTVASVTVVDPSASKPQAKSTITPQPKVKTPKPATPQPKVTTANTANGPVHVVVKGDNLYRISLKYNITISTLRRWNDLVDENIEVGQALRLSRPKK
ncbi:type IV pilus biogenesis/stability protein PilW [Thalassotalea litorea]|uniref:Type IV pilus biogenesis/stability protein PilW n=1 Tax=Thalassotalea litorea TaxID=2020715 RepID=A0A5R9IMI0_9GAMM|nr:type IV pilus biogenesis/stability protein PilW [Thalassotalea litorea]TLU66764.1 type IV pilus biogenesis/stability protein PilW [Thalassotalea litorea]